MPCKKLLARGIEEMGKRACLVRNFWHAELREWRKGHAPKEIFGTPN